MLKQTILNADFFEEFERQNETFLHFFEPDINIYDILSTLAIQPVYFLHFPQTVDDCNILSVNYLLTSIKRCWNILHCKTILNADFECQHETF